MPAKSIVRDIHFEAFLYDICYNLTPEQVNKLKLKSRNMVRTETCVKRFVEKGSMDEKILFLEEVGIPFALSFFPEQISNKTSFKALSEKYSKSLLNEASKEHVAKKFFVTTDREIAFFNGIMAATIHSKSFMLNLEYNKIGNTIQTWSKRLNGMSFDEFNETLDSVNILAKTMFHTLSTKEYVDGFLGVRDKDIVMLLFFFINRHAYVSRDRIFEIFYTVYRNRKNISYIIRRLVDGQFIRKHISIIPQKYMITTNGIRLCYEFMQRVLNSNNF